MFTDASSAITLPGGVATSAYYAREISSQKGDIFVEVCGDFRVGGRHIMVTFLVSNVHPVGRLYDGGIFSCVLDGKRVHTIDHLKNVVAKQKCFVLCGQVTLEQCKPFVALSFIHTHTHTHAPPL